MKYYNFGNFLLIFGYFNDKTCFFGVENNLTVTVFSLASFVRSHSVTDEAFFIAET